MYSHGLQPYFANPVPRFDGLRRIRRRLAQRLLVDQDAVDLDPFGQFHQQLTIAVEMVNLRRLALGEGGHRLHVGPVGDGREPRLVVAVLAQ